jgi:hypothetical protein
MIRPYTIPAWAYFLIGLGLGASLFFSTYVFFKFMSHPEFVGLGIVESGDVSLPYYSSTMLTGCSNKTMGVLARAYTKTTIIAHGCPTTRNFCSEYICNGERLCEEILSSGSMCSEDFDCGDFERCDTATCSCVPDGRKCTSNAQCLNMNMTSECVETFCDIEEGECKTRFINETVDSCETDNNCEDDFICRDCLCISMPEMNVTACTTNSDCTDYTETSMCIESFCNMTTLACETRFQDISYDCDGSCPSEEICTDCVCTPLPTPPIQNECDVDLDCPSTNSTTCLVNTCDDGICVFNRPMGTECSDSSTCLEGQFCNNLCECEDINDSPSGGGFVLILNSTAQASPPVGLGVAQGPNYLFRFNLFSDQSDTRILCWAGGQGTLAGDGSFFVGNIIPSIDRPSQTMIFMVSYTFNNGVGGPTRELPGTLNIRSNGNIDGRPLGQISAPYIFTLQFGFDESVTGNYGLSSSCVTWTTNGYI